MATADKSKFIVDLTGLSLTPAQRTSIKMTIQSAVLSYLAANVDMRGGTILTDFDLFNGMIWGPPTPGPGRKRPKKSSAE